MTSYAHEELAVRRTPGGLVDDLPVRGLGQADRTGGQTALGVDEVHNSHLPESDDAKQREST
jgi:hypothetical protein